MTSSPGGPRATISSASVRLAAPLVGLAAVLAGKALIACRLRRPPEGWRRTLGLLLRSEPTRFSLSAFGLRVPEAPGGRAGVEERTASGLQAFLATQADAHFRLEWRDGITIRRRVPRVDVVLLRFAAGGKLEGLTPCLAPDAQNGCPGRTTSLAHDAIVAGYNRTRHLPEVDRPAALQRDVERTCSASGDAAEYARRLLSACCVSFESIDTEDSAQRFRPPEFRARRNLGCGFLTVVMRTGSSPGSVDVWVSAHHVGLDGVPLQDLLSALERAWGVAEHVTFPPPDRADGPFMPARGCSVAGERAVDEIVTFVDMSPIVALRDSLNERHRSVIGAPITLGALIAWLLNQEPEFAGVRVASTIDVAASDGYDRDVDVVPLRPADFTTGADRWEGLADFASEFNRLVRLSRARTSPLRRQLQTAGLLPAWVHRHVVLSNPAGLDQTFGSLCVTIIRDAKVFVAPMTDLGLGHGFIAIGNTNLPVADGRRVAAVTIKGAPDRIRGHAAVLQRVLDRCRRHLDGREDSEAAERLGVG